MARRKLIGLRELVWQGDENSMPPWVERYADQVLSRSFWQRLTLHLSLKKRLKIRDRFASKYLSGRGIELGAQQVPTKVGANCSVEYVDVIPNEVLVSRYSLPPEQLVPLAHVIDGNDLSVYADDELDFVIANHVLEHFDDPVSGLCEWLRILKIGGRIFLTLPNFRCNCYDFERVPARREHLELDYRDPKGRPARNFEHYVEIATTLYQSADADAMRQLAQHWTDTDNRQHYHVYDQTTVKDVLDLASDAAGLGLKFVNGSLSRNGFEFLLVIEKTLHHGVTNYPYPISDNPK